MNTTLALRTADAATRDQQVALAAAVVLIAGLAVALVVLVCAVVSVLRSPVLSGTGKLLWIVVLLSFPFVGALTWWLWGRAHSPAAARRPVARA